MEVTMIYFSQTGNTRKVAEAMADTFRDLGHSARTISLAKATPEDATTGDLLGVGSPCFTGQAPTPIKDFLRALPPLGHRRAFVFATSGGAPGKVLYDLTRPLYCKGMDVIGGTLIRGECYYPAPCFIGRYPGRPNDEDLARAQRFAIAVAEHVSDGSAGPVTESRPDALKRGWGLYDFEGMLISDPLVRLVLPKPKLNQSKCDKCQWCVYECPTDNIILKPYPSLGGRCIRCYRCLAGCPKKAFHVNWLLGNLVLLSLHSTVFERWFGDLDCDEQIYCDADKPTSNWSLKMLIAALNGKGNSRVSAAAARALGEICHERATSALISALRNVRTGDRARVREATARALGGIGEERATEPLISALRDTDRYVRLAAVRALVNIINERAMEGLIFALKDEHWSVRQAAANALGNYGTRAVEPLIHALDDEHWLVREAAAGALGNIGTSRAVWRLLLSLKDESSVVRNAAREALSKIVE
jgi:flavodoxin/ferredoxin